MQILERSVTRPYWEPSYRFLVKQHRRGNTRPVGKTGVTMIPGTGQMHRIYYAIFCNTPNGPRPIAWLCLWQKTGWLAHGVEQLWTFPNFRGCGHAKALYKAAINVDGIMVASGKSHTKHSKALWENFVRKKYFNIWAHDFKDLRRWCDVYWDDELYSRLPLYDGPGDIRLVALRKN